MALIRCLSWVYKHCNNVGKDLDWQPCYNAKTGKAFLWKELIEGTLIKASTIRPTKAEMLAARQCHHEDAHGWTLGFAPTSEKWITL